MALAPPDIPANLNLIFTTCHEQSRHGSLVANAGSRKLHVITPYIEIFST